MEIEGTRQAFEKMLEVRGVYKYLGVEPPTVSNWKRYLADGKMVSLDKMEEMLEKFGARVKQEKVWRMPYLGGQVVSSGAVVAQLTVETINLLHGSGYSDIRCYKDGIDSFHVKFVSNDGQNMSFTCRLDAAVDALEDGGLAEFLNGMVVLRN